jgi:hypothetical protein
MPKERYFELDITYRCSAACAHCIFGSSPKKGGLMPIADARMYLEEIKRMGFTGSDVIITGGEALLFYDTVLGILRAAAELGMSPIRSLQSNAFWCKSDDLVRQRMVALHEAGLKGIFFSCDPLHQKFVPVENVRRGVRIASEVFGANNVSVSGKNFLENPSEMTVEEYMRVRGGPPVMVARAARELARFFPKIALSEICKMNCRGGNHDLDPTSVWQINIDAYGWVSSWVCSGIALGNAKETPLSEIVPRSIDQHHPMIGAIMERGPAAMLEMAAKHGFQPASEYVSKCHLCWDIRVNIHKHYPALFAPEELYSSD